MTIRRRMPCGCRRLCVALKIWLALAGGLSLLAGCQSMAAVKPVVSLERPQLPRITAADLPRCEEERQQSPCVTDTTFRRLVERELLLREYGEQCEAIIDALAERLQRTDPAVPAALH